MKTENTYFKPIERKLLKIPDKNRKYVYCKPRSGFSNTARAIVSCYLLGNVLNRIVILDGNIPDKKCPITSHFEMNGLEFIDENEFFKDLPEVKTVFKNTKKFSTDQLTNLLKNTEQFIEIRSNQFMFLPDILKNLDGIKKKLREADTKELFVEYFKKIFKPYGRLKKEMAIRNNFIDKKELKCLQIRTGWIETAHPFHWSYDCIDQALDIFSLNEKGDRSFITYVSFDSNYLHDYIRQKLYSNYYNVYILSGKNVHFRSNEITCRDLVKIYVEYLLFEKCKQVAVSYQSSFGAYAVLRSLSSDNATLMTCKRDGLKKTFINLIP